jgi:hypothetical protein
MIGVGLSQIALEPNLPVPGSSNINSLRLGNKIPFALPEGKSDGAGAAPLGRLQGALGLRPNQQTNASAVPGAAPIENNAPETDPRAITNSAPDSIVKRDPAAYHAARYPLVPAVGNFVPFMGKVTTIGNRIGGVPLHPLPLLSGIALPSPTSRATQGTSPKDLRQVIARTQRAAKPMVNLTAGIGGQDVATGRRYVPDLPDGLRETIRPIQGKAFRGVLAQNRAAPLPLVKQMTQTAILAPLDPATSPVSTLAVTDAPTASTISASVAASGGVAVGPSAPLSGADLTPGPTKPASTNLALMAVALVAVMVLMR